MKITFEIEVTTREKLTEAVNSNVLGTRYEYMACIRATDGKKYHLYADADYNDSVVAVPVESDEES